MFVKTVTVTVIVSGASTILAVRMVDPKDQVAGVVIVSSSSATAIAVTSDSAESDVLTRVGNT